ncbi:hypothetical protein GLYMA_14G109950v4 [Glycine max]|nr:hypothetical protein GLYMA_14G109950v4 [Glycine max]KAH1094065.1 hypothetical protein GYH30_039681 [Glycine max]
MSFLPLFLLYLFFSGDHWSSKPGCAITNSLDSITHAHPIYIIHLHSLHPHPKPNQINPLISVYLLFRDQQRKEWTLVLEKRYIQNYTKLSSLSSKMICMN